MPHSEITRWLESSHPSFKKGIYLLETFSGGSHKISKSILSRDTSFSRKKLTQALESINAAIPAQNIISDDKPIKKHKYGHTHGYPPTLVSLEKNLPILRSEINSLANQTHGMPEGDALRDLALDVLDKHQEIRFIWAQLDHFAQFGTEMPGTAPESGNSDLIDILVRWLEIQPALIDYSRRHKNSKDPLKKKEAESRQAQLDEIDAFIKAHKNAGR